jgi:NADPH-dependent curcumin reductase CurA
MPITATRIVLAARPEGVPKLTDFRLERAQLGPLSPGNVALEVLYLSLDPYMRGRMDDRQSYVEPHKIGDVMGGESVSRVIDTNDAHLRAGDLVLAQTGWRSHAIMPANQVAIIDPNVGPLSSRLGVLGMPGFTAYVGLAAIGKPKKGETVVVAAASGPVGSMVGQLAKLFGANAVGIAGGGKKCAYVKDELRFDEVVDHHASDFPTRVAAACSSGIDVYFENVGGPIWEAVLPLLNMHGRVPVCGLLAQYNAAGEHPKFDISPTMRTIIARRLHIEGFLNFDFIEAYHDEFLRTTAPAVKSGQIRYREDVTQGLENASQAFIDMLVGKNFGKALIHVHS